MHAKFHKYRTNNENFSRKRDGPLKGCVTSLNENWHQTKKEGVTGEKVMKGFLRLADRNREKAGKIHECARR